MRGTLRRQGSRWRLDEQANFTSLVSQQVILDELVAFVEDPQWTSRGSSLLDLGAGTKPYEPLYREHFDDCVSVDVPHSRHDTAGVDVMASAASLPFPDARFDCVICTEVLEHCAEPAQVMSEIARVLRPRGRAFITTPFLLPLHEMPYDYYRYTPSALRHLSERAGLTVRRLVPRGSYVSVAHGIVFMPLVKTMQKLEGATRLPFGKRQNPLLFLFVLLPQKAYLALLRRVERDPQSRLALLHEKLTYYASGYITVVEKR